MKTGFQEKGHLFLGKRIARWPMAMLQRDDTIEAIKQLDLLLEYATSSHRCRQSNVSTTSEPTDDEVLE